MSATSLGAGFLANPELNDIKPTDVIKWNISSATLHTDNFMEVPVQLITTDNFSIYQDKVKFVPPAGSVIHKLKYPPIVQMSDPLTSKKVNVVRNGYFSIVLKFAQPFYGDKIRMPITYVGCTDKICLMPHTVEKSAPIYKSDVALYKDEKNEQSTSSQIDQEETPLKNNLNISFLFLCFIGGILTNLTPCVYPMIPITIRVLAKQAKRPFASSSAYALGIMVTYTCLGLFATLSGTIFGSVMSSKGFNISLSIIMVFLAFSMLGFGNFSKIQILGNKLGTGKASLRNSFLMGSGAGLVASPCTGPVLAMLLTYAATNANYLETILLLGIYSFGFSLPYVFLGGAAAKVTNIKLSPKFQIAVKLFFASVIFALGLFYLKVPLHSYFKHNPIDWELIAVSFLGLGTIMVGIICLSTKLLNRKNFLIAPTIAIGIGLFAFSQKVDFDIENKALSVNWTYDENAALTKAQMEDRPILVDAWAEWCLACKKMDETTFRDRKIIDFLRSNGFITLKLDLTESNAQNDVLQKKYNIKGLPTLIIIPRGGDLTEKKLLVGMQTAALLLPELEKYK